MRGKGAGGALIVGAGDLVERARNSHSHFYF